jgi:hypothetical protein
VTRALVEEFEDAIVDLIDFPPRVIQGGSGSGCPRIAHRSPVSVEGRR